MDTMRERLLSRLAIFAEGKPADETADAIMAIVAEDREKLVAALDEARNALKIALPAVDEHGLNMDRHIVRKAIVGCDSAIATTKLIQGGGT